MRHIRIMTPNPTQTKVQNKHTNKQTSNQQQPVPINMDVQIFIATDISKFEPPHLPQNKTKKKTTTKKSIASKTNNKYKISKNVNKILKAYYLQRDKIIHNKLN